MSDTPRLDSRRRFGVRQTLSGATPGEPCAYAVQFTVFTDALHKEMEGASHSVHVNRAKLLLTDQYFRLKRTAPAEHQDTATYNGHPCLYAVFCAAYEELDRIALRVMPPAFEVPPRPPARSRRKPVAVLPQEWSDDLLHQAIFADGKQ